MQRPELIIIDFDGTIVDSLEALVRITLETLENFQIEKDEELARKLIGIPTHERFVKHGMAEEDVKTATTMFNKLHASDTYKDVVEMKGIKHWLTQYKDVPKWIVTNSPLYPVEQSLKRLELSHFFDQIISKEDLNGQSKLTYLRNLPKLAKYWPKWVIGDENSDLQAGSYIGAITFLMNNPRNSHLQDFADFSINSYDDFLPKDIKYSPMNNQYVKKAIEYLSDLDMKAIIKISKKLASSITSGKSIFFAANGGSLAIARHFGIDIRKTVMASGYQINLHVLGIEAETLTAFSNDNSWDVALSLEMRTSIKKGDLVAIFSTSGNSSNLLALKDVVEEREAHMIAMTPPNLLQNNSIISAALFEDVLSVTLHMMTTFVRKLLISPNENQVSA